jgi:hypothetical protein
VEGGADKEQVSGTHLVLPVIEAEQSLLGEKNLLLEAMLPPILKEPSMELFHKLVKGEAINHSLSGVVLVTNAKILESKDNQTDLAVISNTLVEIISQACILQS